MEWMRPPINVGGIRSAGGRYLIMVQFVCTLRKRAENEALGSKNPMGSQVRHPRLAKAQRDRLMLKTKHIAFFLAMTLLFSEVVTAPHRCQRFIGKTITSARLGTGT